MWCTPTQSTSYDNKSIKLNSFNSLWGTLSFRETHPRVRDESLSIMMLQKWNCWKKRRAWSIGFTSASYENKSPTFIKKKNQNLSLGISENTSNVTLTRSPVRGTINIKFQNSWLWWKPLIEFDMNRWSLGFDFHKIQNKIISGIRAFLPPTLYLPTNTRYM